VAFGRSEKNAIMHLKTGVMDGLDCFSGSTNWSESGEDKQDNELSFTRHPMIAFRLRHKIDLIHASMLQQEADKNRATLKILEGARIIADPYVPGKAAGGQQ
jgi:phosphatidylserine/phosphatidylglycerophosphate/cardiolipin synthase-like enzyme